MFSSLTLEITDSGLLTQLSNYGDSEGEQQAVALVALRIGLQALHYANGDIDKFALQRTAEGILDNLSERAEMVLNRMEEEVEGILTDNSEKLLRQFSFDQPDSAISKLSDHTSSQIEKIHTTIIDKLGRKEERNRNTGGGVDYEEKVGALLGSIMWGGDCLESTGTLPGTNGKIGDFVVTLGKDCPAAGEHIVVEAKRDKQYNRKRIMDECHAARENREAQVAVFVWYKSYGDQKFQPTLERDGDTIIVLWDHEDESTDIYVRAAYWLARSLVRPKTQNIVPAQQFFLDEAIEQISNWIKILDSMKKTSRDIISNARDIGSEIDNIRTLIDDHIENLQKIHLSASS